MAYSPPTNVRERFYEDRVLPPVPKVLVFPSIASLCGPVASIDVHTETPETQ